MESVLQKIESSKSSRINRIESCLDYQAFSYLLDPAMSAKTYQVKRQQLMTLGNTCEERMGVVYVRGPWGFFVIPDYGYPTLRISFFHDTPANEIQEKLKAISALFEYDDTIYLGDVDE
jgi:hypothetical protein